MYYRLALVLAVSGMSAQEDGTFMLEKNHHWLMSQRWSRSGQHSRVLHLHVLFRYCWRGPCWDVTKNCVCCSKLDTWMCWKWLHSIVTLTLGWKGWRRKVCPCSGSVIQRYVFLCWGLRWTILQLHHNHCQGYKHHLKLCKISLHYTWCQSNKVSLMLLSFI